MDPLAPLRLARTELDRRAAAISDDQWDLPTPCPDWTVHQLVDHLSGGNRMSVLLLSGGSREEVMKLIGASSRSSDPLAELTASLDAADAAFVAAGELSGTVSHPIGDIPTTQFLGFRIGDYAVHTWDLARAIGADENLDADLVAGLWEQMSPMAPMIGTTGVFGEGPSGDVDETAPLQTRLLDLTGRRP